MLEHMEHGDGGTSARRKRGTRKRRANGRDAGAPPSHAGRIERKVKADHVRLPSFGQHLEKEATAAAHIDHDSLGFRLAQRALHEAKMIAQHDAAVPLLQAIGGGPLGGEPVLARVVITEFEWRGLRKEPDQPALAALDDEKGLLSGGVQPVTGGKQRAGFGFAAGPAGVAGRARQIACSEISRSRIRCRNRSWRICRGLRRCFDWNARLLRSMEGIIGNAQTVPHSNAVAACSFPIGPA